MPFCDIDNAQAAASQGRAEVRAIETPILIGPAVVDRLAHLRQSREALLARELAIEDSGDTTHRGVLGEGEYFREALPGVLS